MSTKPNKVQAIRKAQGKTIERVASDADCSSQYLQMVESGRVANPSIAKARRIADALGVTVDEAFPPLIPSQNAEGDTVETLKGGE